MRKRKGLLGLVLGLSIGLFPKEARAVEVNHDIENTTYSVTSFSDIDRKYVLAGKTPGVLGEVKFLLRELSKTGYKGRMEDLLDGKNGNYEFAGITINESDPFNPATAVFYLDKSGKAQHFYRSGITSSQDQVMLSMEVGQMRGNIRDGLRAQENYGKLGLGEVKVRLIRALDEQAGRVKGATAKWTPSFENQMGFKTEDDFNEAIKNSNEIGISYAPNSSFSVSNHDDFKMVYTLKNGKKITKYVDDFPLHVLEDKEDFAKRKRKRDEEYLNDAKERSENFIKSREARSRKIFGR